MDFMLKNAKKTERTERLLSCMVNVIVFDLRIKKICFFIENMYGVRRTHANTSRNIGKMAIVYDPLLW